MGYLSTKIIQKPPRLYATRNSTNCARQSAFSGSNMTLFVTDDKPEIVRYTDWGAESAIVLTANLLASGRLCIEALTDSEDIVEICEDYILVGVGTITRQIVKENEINNNKQPQEI